MFRADLAQVLQRNIDFTSDGVKKGVLLHIEGIEGLDVPAVKPLEEWNLPQEYPAYIDACIAREKEVWAQRAGLQDDTLPSMKPYYGIAEHSAFVGGKVVYGGNTSYHEHPLTSWDAFDTLTLDENNENFKMLMDSLRYMKKRSAEEGFLAMQRGGEAPMDMANAIRGNDLFMDFYDEEENVHRLIEFCLKASRWTFAHQSEIIGRIQGGVVSGLGVWLPGNSIGHLSEDASSMCSAELYREFGQPYTRRLLDDYDCTIMHVHTMGRHVLPDIAAIDKIKFIQLTYDPNQITPIEVYKEYAEVLKNKIVLPSMTADEIEENLAFLAAHKSIVQVYAKSMQEAKKAVELIRSIQ